MAIRNGRTVEFPELPFHPVITFDEGSLTDAEIDVFAKEFPRVARKPFRASAARVESKRRKRLAKEGPANG